MIPAINPQARATAERVSPSTDPRGLVVEPLGPDEFPNQRNAHLVLTAPGSIRGNHYHPRGAEVMLVLGPALVRVRDLDGTRDHAVAEGEATRFCFPPGVPHALLNTGPDVQITLSFNTVPHDPAQPDVVREILIEPGSMGP